MSTTIKGTITEIQPLQSFSSGFQKQTILVHAVDGKFSKTYPISFTKEKIGLLSNLKEADVVEVSFNIHTNEYKGKWFVELVAWKIQLLDVATTAEETDEELF